MDNFVAARGRPRYLNGKLPMENLEMLVIISRSSLAIPATKMLDFNRLTFIPEHSPKLLNLFSRNCTEGTSTLKNRMRSSTNDK